MKSIIIDDEEANREVLTVLLETYCPEVNIAGTAATADEGYELIRQQQPDLVFLDVRMPGKTGLDLLRQFDQIDFQVIFVTAHDQYALQAFEFSAVDYLLKPVDYEKLIRSVKKAEHNRELRDNSHVLRIMNTVDKQSLLLKRIALHKNDTVMLVDIDQISHVEAIGNYCEIVTFDNQRFLSSKTLLAYEQLLSAYSFFLRINKKMLVNIHAVLSYTKGSDCFITLKNQPEEQEVSRRKKGEILQALKKI